MYNFTNNWFETSCRPYWEFLLPKVKLEKVLEIGAYEGAASCYLLNHYSASLIELHCLDTWTGGIEHQTNEHDFSEIEKRFDSNIANALTYNNNKALSFQKHKIRSFEGLCALVSKGYLNYFDFIYIDGGHTSEIVLQDSILAFSLLKNGGILGFDDYLWKDTATHKGNPLASPKLAIDTFTTIYQGKLEILPVGITQIYCKKLES